MRASALRCAVMTAVALNASPGSAQDAAPSDNVVMLPCDGHCPSITLPARLSGTAAEFPDRFAWGDYVEAFVDFEYTIGADGHISDVHIKRLLGPQQFADVARRSLENWVYKPATLNGEPVAVSHELHYYFSVPNAPVGGRPATARAYENAVSLIKDDKIVEALAVLRAASAQPKLNFYERGMLASLTAPALEAQGDTVGARDLSRLALSYGRNVLPPAVLRNLYHVEIRSSLALGDIVDAAKSLGRLAHTRGFDAADPVIGQVRDMKTKIDAAPSYGAAGRIPAADEADGYSFWLYRRYFSFADVVGKLERVTINCQERQVESPIKAQIDWHIPQEWSDCSIFVRGTPGTTFKIVQIKPDKAVAP